jgi:hypothetical protein
VQDSKLDHPIVKRDVSASKGKNDAAKGEATLNLPNWYALKPFGRVQAVSSRKWFSPNLC